MRRCHVLTYAEARALQAAHPPRRIEPEADPEPVRRNGPPPGWVGLPGLAALLGRPDAWILRNLPLLEREGFPPRCRIVGLWEVARVQAWADRRAEEQNPPPRTFRR